MTAPRTTSLATAPGYRLEDLSVGQKASREFLVTSAVVEAFAELSGDNNAIHLDEAYALTTPFKGRVAHGMLTGAFISAVLGGQMPGSGAVYLSQTLSFRRPVRIDDTVTVEVTVTAIDAERARATFSTVGLVAGKPVATGEAVVSVPRRGD